MKFYQLKLAISSVSSFAGFDIVGKAMYSEDAPRCPHCNEKIGSLKWLPPHKVKIESRPLGDFCSNGSSFLLSHRFRNEFEKSHLTGLTFSKDPVEAKPSSSISYYVALPNNVLTHLDESASRVEIKEVCGCDRCRVISRIRIACLRIDESTWQGEDIFLPSGLFGVTIVTEKFVEFVKLNKFTNFVFVHQDDYKEDRSLLLGL